MRFFHLATYRILINLLQIYFYVTHPRQINHFKVVKLTSTDFFLKRRFASLAEINFAVRYELLTTWIITYARAEAIIMIELRHTEGPEKEIAEAKRSAYRSHGERRDATFRGRPFESVHDNNPRVAAIVLFSPAFAN